MTTWNGSVPVSGASLPNSIISTDITTGGGLDFTHRGYEPSTISQGTVANTLGQPLAMSHEVNPGPASAYRFMSPGDFIFERIHVFPQVKTLPMIISPVLIPVEVWNAFRATPEQVSSVTVAGPAGVSIQTAYTLPIIFPPFASNVYIVKVDTNGAPSADNTILWDFDGLSEPLFHVTGLRLLPFTISPDWASGISDTYGWLTDIMRAYDDTEQRMQLRDNPKRSVTYSAAALDDREAGLLMSLLWAWQARSYGVPLWTDAAQLGGGVLNAGSVTVLVDTTNMTIVDGVDTVILISDAFTWFASPVQAHDAGSITLQTPTDKDFPANTTVVVPVKLGRMKDTVPVKRPTNTTAVMQVQFELQTAQLV